MKSNNTKTHLNFMAAGIVIIFIVFCVLISMINTKQFIVNQQIKTAFATIGIILTIIHWKMVISTLL